MELDIVNTTISVQEETTNNTGEAEKVFEEPQSASALLDKVHTVDHSDWADSNNLVQLWIREASVNPLLKEEEEVYLAQLMEKGEAAKEKLEGVDNLTQSEIEELLTVVDTGTDAMQTLVSCNLRLVLKNAFKIKAKLGHFPFISLEDLIQQGNVGLLESIMRYDWRIAKVSTYATYWIQQSIYKWITDETNLIRLPNHISERMRKFRKLEASFKQKNGRDPSDEELCEQFIIQQLEKELDRPPSDEETCEAIEDKFDYVFGKRKELARYRKPVQSLDDVIRAEDENTTLGELVPDKNPSPDEIADKAIMLDTVRTALAEADLKEIEIKAVGYKYGLNEDRRTLTLQETGDLLGCSSETVRIALEKALSKMRSPKILLKLRPYLELTHAETQPDVI